MNYTIQLHNQDTIKDIRTQFNTLFPYLKMEFFHEPSGKGKLLSKDKMIGINEKLSKISTSFKEGNLAFTNQTTVGELEHKLFTDFGLCVQVFRKSGNLWLETSATDSWSLDQQNEEGKSLAVHWNIEKENLNDHDIY